VEHTGVHQFQVSGADGQLHSYVVTEHPAGEGMEIMYSLLGLGAPTVLGLAGAALQSEEMLRSILKAVGGADLERSSGDLSALGKLVADLDLEKLGAELSRALGTGKAPELTRRVLAKAFRDGKPLVSHFDIAYQANYGELLQAVWKVCTINRFFPVPSISQSSSFGVPTKALQSQGSVA